MHLEFEAMFPGSAKINLFANIVPDWIVQHAPPSSLYALIGNMIFINLTTPVRAATDNAPAVPWLPTLHLLRASSSMSFLVERSNFIWPRDSDMVCFCCKCLVLGQESLAFVDKGTVGGAMMLPSLNSRSTCPTLITNSEELQKCDMALKVRALKSLTL